VTSAAVRITGLALIAVVLASGCGRQVAVEPPPQLTPGCSERVAALPDIVDGAGRRPTSPRSEATAAWGEPPIVLRCGVARPSALESTSVLLEVDGIGWFPEPLEAGTVFTAVTFDPEAFDSDGFVDTEPFIEVIIPDAYSSPGGIIADISSALVQKR
jgi:hypothetical protein